MRIGVHRIAMGNPGDFSALAKLIEAGSVDPTGIVAVIGKTEGNGGANDFTRGFATLSLSLLLARHLSSRPRKWRNASPSSGRAAPKACCRRMRRSSLGAPNLRPPAGRGWRSVSR